MTNQHAWYMARTHQQEITSSITRGDSRIIPMRYGSNLHVPLLHLRWRYNYSFETWSKDLPVRMRPFDRLVNVVVNMLWHLVSTLLLGDGRVNPMWESTIEQANEKGWEEVPDVDGALFDVARQIEWEWAVDVGGGTWRFGWRKTMISSTILQILYIV